MKSLNNSALSILLQTMYFYSHTQVCVNKNTFVSKQIESAELFWNITLLFRYSRSKRGIIEIETVTFHIWKKNYKQNSTSPSIVFVDLLKFPKWNCRVKSIIYVMNLFINHDNIYILTIFRINEIYILLISILNKRKVMSYL